MVKMPALLLAVLGNHIEAVKTLLQLGADRMIRSGAADSALHYAAEVCKEGQKAEHVLLKQRLKHRDCDMPRYALLRIKSEIALIPKNFVHVIL